MEARQAEEAAELEREAEREANGGVLFRLVRVPIIIITSPFSPPRSTTPPYPLCLTLMSMPADRAEQCRELGLQAAAH